MPRRLVIAIDCDDVLVDTAHDLMNFYNQKYGTNIDETDFYTDFTRERAGVDTLHDAIERFNERLMMQEHHDIAPLPQTVEVIRRLAKQHELHIVTGRQEMMEHATRGMIDKYFPGCFASIEHTNFMTNDHTAKKRTKGEVCLSIKADVIIEDYIEHIRGIIDAGVPYAILFGDFDWGKRGNLPDRTTRCLDWIAVEKEVARIANT